ncbi:hypothetical protein [Phormidium tenue]|uniref:Uncharacterized protein n=1 Tax=Phormidium tenue NIES-30 TaxID=549789 RepID=A0A1U7J6K0_9CYAN|nr:hypothetical protein [Phormidium tenue]MBD2233525.1 hypothetical protein [Phormidium tenue FACHB-1052]OKH48635.1 hypothetical protein NIES30_08780 [Phormidium tenue NIES-30]
MNSRQTLRFSIGAIVLGLAEIGGAIASPVQAQSGAIAPPPAYWNAVEDARTPEPSEVFRDLTAITRYNSALTWDDHGSVLMATWADWVGYTQNVGSRLIVTRDVWVTAVPDLQNFCKAYTPTPEISLAARLGQVLGLPPEPAVQSANRRVVEVWVEPQFLFRPSPDPEITDHEAELTFRTANEFASVPSSYLHWFYAQYDQRYQYQGQPIAINGAEPPGALPYPWTQLGYTYDWGDRADWATLDPARPDHVGLSEFVIRQWSPITIQAAQPVNDYCR